MSEEAASHVLGGQANLWTEFVAEKELAMYMTFPRLAALAEKLWTPKDLTDWTDFSRRLPKLFSRYDQIGINYAKSVYLVQAKAEMLLADKIVLLTLTNELPNSDIRYILGDKELTTDAKKYSEPLEISETTIVKAALFENDKVVGKIFVDTIKFHNAVARPVDYKTIYSDRYQGQGDFTLTNAVRGSKNFHDGQWQGWINNDMEVIIDLENEQDVRQVSVGTLENQGSGIYFPVIVEVSTSTDGHSYQKQGELKRKFSHNGEPGLKDFVVNIDSIKTRFIKVEAINLKTPPNGDGSWLFVDEITVN
jgi:hexosaminidase